MTLLDTSSARHSLKRLPAPTQMHIIESLVAAGHTGWDLPPDEVLRSVREAPVHFNQMDSAFTVAQRRLERFAIEAMGNGAQVSLRRILKVRS